jgi:2-iminobutanoate/2-iminopropanoate deaminase
MKSGHITSSLVLIVSLASLLCAQAEEAKRTNINLQKDQAVSPPFSDAVLVGKTLYISGRLGLDPKTRKPPADPKEEAKLLLDGYKAVLEKANMSMDNLVSVTVYCPDLTLYATFNEVYRSYFNKDLPARAFIASGTLLFGAHFEMQGIAVKQ